MKESFIYIFSAFCFSCGINSCSFLDGNPVDRLIADNFYTNERDAQAAVGATYQQLNSSYNRLMCIMTELPTDMMKNGLGMPNANLQDLEFLRLNSRDTFAKDMWKNCYSGISEANTAIAKIPETKMNESKKNQLIAEARTLRAPYYFNLVRFFGDVLLILGLKTVEDPKRPRNSKELIHDQIIEDLTFAEEHLPLRSEYSASDEGRINKGAAKILFGKVYLAKGDFQRTKDRLAEVVEYESEYGSGLYKDYYANWLRDTEAGIEAVLYIEYKEPSFQHNGGMALAGPKYSIPGSLGISTLNEADIPTQKLYDQLDNRDLGKKTNFKTEFAHPKTGKILKSSIPLSGKFWVEGLETGDCCDVSVHIIRYADAILVYAEALSEVGKSTEAFAMLDRIQERAFGDDSGNFKPMSKDEFRTTILNERRLEFPHEGHRWFDLVRTDTSIQRMKEHSAYEARVAEANKTEIAQNIKGHMTLMPILQSEIDLNPNLVQNAGY